MFSEEFDDKVRVLVFRILANLVYYLSIYIVITQPYELIICAIIVWAFTTPKWVFTYTPQDEEPYTEEEICHDRMSILLFSFISDVHISVSAWASQGNWMVFLIFEAFAYFLKTEIIYVIEKLMKYCGLCYDDDKEE